MHQIPRLATGADAGDFDVFVRKQFNDAGAFGRVVIDHQQLLDARFGEFLNSGQGGFESLGGDGFVQVGESAALKTVLAFLFHGDDLHRDVACGRVLLEMAQDRPSQHVRQENVQTDGSGLEFPRQRQSHTAAHSHQAFEALVACQPQQDPRVMWIIFDNQQHGIALLDIVAIVGHRFRTGGRQNFHGRDFGIHRARHGRTGVRLREVESKCAAFAKDAGELDLTPEQVGQLAADGQAQSCAAVLAAGAGIGLLESLKNNLLFFWRNANARVDDFEGEH